MWKNEWVPIICVTGHSLVHMYDMKTKNILWSFFCALVPHSEHKKTPPKHECFMSRLWMSHFHVRDMMHSGRVHIYMKWLISEWVISHTAIRYVMNMNASFHIHQCVMSYILMSLHSQKYKARTYECGTSQMFMNHLKYINESRHKCEWVMSRISIRHVICKNESCHVHPWVTSYIWTSHVTYMNASCHIYGWVMSHTLVRHVIHMNVLYHILEWVTSQIRTSPVTCINASWHMYKESCHIH